MSLAKIGRSPQRWCRVGKSGKSSQKWKREYLLTYAACTPHRHPNRKCPGGARHTAGAPPERMGEPGWCAGSISAHVSTFGCFCHFCRLCTTPAGSGLFWPNSYAERPNVTLSKANAGCFLDLASSPVALQQAQSVVGSVNKIQATF